MKIAIPVANGQLAPHFGHCAEFAFFEVDPEKKEIIAEVTAPPPPHEPGVLPRWLGECDVNLVLTGGMGQRAQALFAAAGIEVLTGIGEPDPRALVEAWLNGSLESGDNLCDH